MGHYYDDCPVPHMAAYSLGELFMEREHLAFDLLELMMVDLSYETPDDLARSLSKRAYD